MPFGLFGPMGAYSVLFSPMRPPHCDDRVRACYQHCTLKWVMSERMTNQTLRERFHLPESKVASISQVISATLEAKLIKLDEKAGGSRKFARYLPFWA
jgi:ATP-dependent DNA helicase RecG